VLVSDNRVKSSVIVALATTMFLIWAPLCTDMKLANVRSSKHLSHAHRVEYKMVTGENTSLRNFYPVYSRAIYEQFLPLDFCK